MVKLPDETVLAQMAAIMCAVGRVLGLAGASAAEEARAMMVTLNANQLVQEWPTLKENMTRPTLTSFAPPHATWFGTRATSSPDS